MKRTPPTTFRSDDPRVIQLLRLIAEAQAACAHDAAAFPHPFWTSVTDMLTALELAARSGRLAPLKEGVGQGMCRGLGEICLDTGPGYDACARVEAHYRRMSQS